MLEMLIKLPDYRISGFIRQHFDDLFSLNLKSFKKYLEVCFFKHRSLNEVKTVKWTLDTNEDFIDYHTSFIGGDFY